MMVADSEVHPMEDPEGELERALIEEFLFSHGHTPRDVPALPQEQRRHLLEAASVYAAGRLAEIQARAHYVHDLHHQD
jgi:hypothetical protein